MTLTTFTTKSGKQADIRYVESMDVQLAMDFINSVSVEDTFITFSGEQQTLEEEQKYILNCVDSINRGDMVKLHCMTDGRIAAECSVRRDMSGKRRSHHTAILGLVVHKDYRGEGIGERMIRCAIDEAWKKIEGLQIITLWCYDGNTAARSLYEKIGFKECGRLPKGVLFHGEYIDHVYMYLNNPERNS